MCPSIFAEKNFKPTFFFRPVWDESTSRVHPNHSSTPPQVESGSKKLDLGILSPIAYTSQVSYWPASVLVLRTWQYTRRGPKIHTRASEQKHIDHKYVSYIFLHSESSSTTLLRANFRPICGVRSALRGWQGQSKARAGPVRNSVKNSCHRKERIGISYFFPALVQELTFHFLTCHCCGWSVLRKDFAKKNPKAWLCTSHITSTSFSRWRRYATKLTSRFSRRHVTFALSKRLWTNVPSFETSRFVSLAFFLTLEQR